MLNERESVTKLLPRLERTIFFDPNQSTGGVRILKLLAQARPPLLYQSKLSASTWASH